MAIGSGALNSCLCCSVSSNMMASSPGSYRVPDVRATSWTPERTRPDDSHGAERKRELARRIHVHLDALHRLAFCHALEHLARNRRQQRAGDDLIDIARPALDFLAAPGNRVDDRRRVLERHAMGRLHAFADALHLK